MIGADKVSGQAYKRVASLLTTHWGVCREPVPVLTVEGARCRLTHRSGQFVDFDFRREHLALSDADITEKIIAPVVAELRGKLGVSANQKA